jgi:glucan 1,3-beta-glucosidase
MGIVDEWTLSTYLGRENASFTLETHYDTFFTKSTFQEIAQAGLDHVRISFPYWFVENVDPSDPYVAQIGWRYLLRAIEYCREFGIRVNLCLHAAPGSQNGFNHSGRQGAINWLMGYFMSNFARVNNQSKRNDKWGQNYHVSGAICHIL